MYPVTGASGGATRSPLLRMPTMLVSRDPCHNNILPHSSTLLQQLVNNKMQSEMADFVTGAATRQTCQNIMLCLTNSTQHTAITRQCHKQNFHIRCCWWQHITPVSWMQTTVADGHKFSIASSTNWKYRVYCIAVRGGLSHRATAISQYVHIRGSAINERPMRHSVSVEILSTAVRIMQTDHISATATTYSITCIVLDKKLNQNTASTHCYTSHRSRCNTDGST